MNLLRHAYEKSNENYILNDKQKVASHVILIIRLGITFNLIMALEMIY